MKNLENYGVQELNTKEMKDIDGGVWVLIALAVMVGILIFTQKN